jgi:hypothetical protein
MICLVVLVLFAVFIGIQFHMMALSRIHANIIDQNNVSTWYGAWTNIQPENKVTQSFKPKSNVLTGVGIDIVTGNRGRGGDTITIKVKRAEEPLATVSRYVAEDFNGLLLFKMPRPINVVPGEVLEITVSDTGKIVFGWKRGYDTYKDGNASFYGREEAEDFFFQTYSSR